MRHSASRPTALVLWLIAGAALPAAGGVQRLRAQVTDSQGNALRGVRVEVTCPLNTEYSRLRVTDSQGRFELSLGETVDTVDLKLELAGYHTLVKRVGPEPVEGTLKLRLRQLTDSELVYPGQQHQQARQAYERGLAAGRAEDWNSAREAFQRAVDLRPDVYQGWSELAEAEYNLGHYQEAIEAANQALQLASRSVHTEDLSALVSTARSLSGPAEEPGAASGADGESPEAVAGRAFAQAMTLVDKGADEQALVRFREAIAARPEFAPAHYELGLALMRRGNKQSAARHLLRFTRLDPSSPRVPLVLTLLDGLEAESRQAETRD
jgi:tetratricopeptide (TPR) repeat protein